MCMDVRLNACLCTVCMPSHKDQKGASGPRELELLVAVSCHVDGGKWAPSLMNNHGLKLEVIACLA